MTEARPHATIGVSMVYPGDLRFLLAALRIIDFLLRQIPRIDVTLFVRPIHQFVAEFLRALGDYGHGLREEDLLQVPVDGGIIDGAALLNQITVKVGSWGEYWENVADDIKLHPDEDHFAIFINHTEKWKLIPNTAVADFQGETMNRHFLHLLLREANALLKSGRLLVFLDICYYDLLYGGDHPYDKIVSIGTSQEGRAFGLKVRVRFDESFADEGRPRVIYGSAGTHGAAALVKAGVTARTWDDVAQVMRDFGGSGVDPRVHVSPAFGRPPSALFRVGSEVTQPMQRRLDQLLDDEGPDSLSRVAVDFEGATQRDLPTDLCEWLSKIVHFPRDGRDETGQVEKQPKHSWCAAILMAKRESVKLEVVRALDAVCQVIVNEACESHGFDFVEAEPIYFLGHVIEVKGKDQTADEFFGLCELSREAFLAEAKRAGWV